MRFSSGKGCAVTCPLSFGGSFGLVLGFLLSLALAPSSLAATPPPSWFDDGPRPTVSIVSIVAQGADLVVSFDSFEGAPPKVKIDLETALGQPVSSVLVVSPSDGPPNGRKVATLLGAAKRFLTDGADYRVRARDPLTAVELVTPMPFAVALLCEGEVCRFVPQLGIATGSALWLDGRLAAKLVAPGSSPPLDLLAAAVASDPSLVGSARSLAARLASTADGLCHCRWTYATDLQVCEEGMWLEINAKGTWIREDLLAAQRTRRHEVDLTAACWQARAAGTESLRIAFGAEVVKTAWPRVEISNCGACSGDAEQRARFYGSTSTFATGPQVISTQAEWGLTAQADGSLVVTDSDLAVASAPNGSDFENRSVDWTGSASSLSWQNHLSVRFEAPEGATRAQVFSSLAARVISLGNAPCAEPPFVSVERQSAWNQPSNASTTDPDQISVVIGECRPPR